MPIATGVASGFESSFSIFLEGIADEFASTVGLERNNRSILANSLAIAAIINFYWSGNPIHAYGCSVSPIILSAPFDVNNTN